jgi:hypothetical protein
VGLVKKSVCCQFNTKSYRSRGLRLWLAPRHYGAPNCNNPRTGNTTQYRKVQVWVKGGDRHGPVIYLMKNFHNDVKKILIIEHHLVPQSPSFFTTHFGYAFFAIFKPVNPS